MKLKNAPGRKNARRLVAFQNMAMGNGPNSKAHRLNRERRNNPVAESATLTARLMSDSVARGIRTKKDRSARGRLTR